MASDRQYFDRQRERIEQIDDESVRDSLLGFCAALDPENHQHQIAEKGDDGRPVSDPDPITLRTGGNYLKHLVFLDGIGLDLLGSDADDVNAFMDALVTDPERRTGNLVDHDNSPSKPSAVPYQSAVKIFLRWCSEPGNSDRPEVAAEWPVDDVVTYSAQSDPKHGPDDTPEQEDLRAMREACERSQNPYRDLALLQLLAGTGQRIKALVTLRVGDVRLDDDTPHIMLNPEIDGQGDKGAIQNAGRFRLIVTDTEPVRQWVEHHPLRDPEVRAEYDAPDDFDDCYLFVGSPRQRATDLSNHLGTEAVRNTLERRRDATEDMTGVETVDVPVNPHNWRHFFYSKGKRLGIPEATLKIQCGWTPDSDTGERIYQHIETEEALREQAEDWTEGFGDADPEGVRSALLGITAGSDLPADVRDALASDDDLMDDLADAVADRLAD